MRPAAVLLAALAIGTGCKDSDEPPTPGVLVGALASPRDDDGALLLKIAGPGIGEVREANPRYRMFWRSHNDSLAFAIVVGDLQDGPVVRVNVPDVHQRERYFLEVVQVADREDLLRSSVTGYAVRLIAQDR